MRRSREDLLRGRPGFRTCTSSSLRLCMLPKYTQLWESNLSTNVASVGQTSIFLRAHLPFYWKLGLTPEYNAPAAHNFVMTWTNNRWYPLTDHLNASVICLWSLPLLYYTRWMRDSISPSLFLLTTSVFYGCSCFWSFSRFFEASATLGRCKSPTFPEWLLMNLMTHSMCLVCLFASLLTSTNARSYSLFSDDCGIYCGFTSTFCNDSSILHRHGIG